MHTSLKSNLAVRVALLAALCSPAYATVTITSMKSSVKSPQQIGSLITFTVTATDSASGQLAFRFNITPPGGTSTMADDFNLGTLSAGAWTVVFVWAPTACSNLVQSTGVVALSCQEIEGTYQVQVVAKDFVSGESADKIVQFQIDPLAGGSPVVTAMANPLVALFSAPACLVGSTMRVNFQPQSKSAPATTTSWVPCRGRETMNFEIAGMYPATAYQMFAQTDTGGVIANGPTVNFTTGQLPTDVPFPSFTVNTPAGPKTDTAAPVLLLNPHQFGGGAIYPNLATDLAGNIIWFYGRNPPQNLVLARPLAFGTMLTIQSDPAWNPASSDKQMLVQIDLAGNLIRRTNTGILQQELLALGATDAGPCTAIPSPPPVGSACLDDFHHDAIQTLPNGDTAVLVSIEKIFPPGTQGDTSGLPVDILGDMIVVLDSNWQAIWYFDAFEHDGGPPQLDINRPAVLNITCGKNADGCPPMFLLGPGIAPLGYDWLHGNSIYYWPHDQAGVAGEIIWSARNQDWVMKIDYQNGAGSGNILWRMGNAGDFTFNNIDNDPWPWFSGQHDVAMENNGAGPLSAMDNGNTRTSPPPLGLGSACGPSDCNSRGMALRISESAMQVTPELSVNLGEFSTSGGNAQLLPDGNYYFQLATVLISLSSEDSFALEILPKAGALTGKQVLNVETTESYRGWQLISLYDPPIS
ncbi:MAG: aryl-sulfate sulfotransferase [Bryobacteraceae bacterium]|jgi:hypothetical protein